MPIKKKLLFALMLCGLYADLFSAGIPPREGAAIQARIDAASTSGGPAKYEVVSVDRWGNAGTRAE